MHDEAKARKRREWHRTTGMVLVLVMLFLLSGSGEATTWTVTSGADDGVGGTLRNVVASAADGDTIHFASGITTVTLTSYLFLDKSLTINGPATIRQTGTSQRVLYLTKSCTLNDLTITGGNINNNGAGMFNYGDDTVMNRCTVSGNTTGGGVYNVKNLTMRNCRIADNTAVYPRKGAGINNEASASSTPNLKMYDCVVENNFTKDNIGGGIFNGETLYMSGCTVKNNESKPSSGGGIYTNLFATTTLVNGCAVYDNKPDQINGSGTCTADSTCTIGSAPNKSATAFAGFAGDVEPQPRSIADDPDVTTVENALADSGSDLFATVEAALSGDLNGTPGSVTAALAGITASLYYANTFEDVALEENDLIVEYTASWPERVRYYSLFARADGSGYELPERGVQFEIKPGQSLPEGVTPPDFYEKGEGLMTWRNVVADGGPYDLNDAEGVVTFRVCSVRAAATRAPDSGGSGGCNVGAVGGAASALPFVVLLLAPLCALPRPKKRN